MSQLTECPSPNYTMLPVKGLTLAVDTSGLEGILPPGEWEQNLEENGWIKFPNGLILQWGTYSDSAKGNVTVLFNKPFTRSPFTAVATYLNANGVADIGVSGLASSSMVVSVDTSKASPLGFRWIALGV